jgi:hypothetical protein
VLFAEDSTEFSKRIGVGQVTKLTVLPRLELFLQSEPLVISQTKDQTVVHEGDVFAGVQSVLFAGDESRPTVSISYVRRVHTSLAPELDVGTFRQSTSTLLSEDLKGFHFDTNGILAEQVQGDVGRAQFKHCPFPIPWGSSQFPGRCGISHNHSTRATPSVISGRFPAPFARIWWSTQDSIMD